MTKIIKTEISNIIRQNGIEGSHKTISEAIDNLSTAIDIIAKDSLEIKIIETIALTSENENIILLKQELFTAVKLLYNDVIKDTFRVMQHDNTLTNEKRYASSNLINNNNNNTTGNKAFTLATAQTYTNVNTTITSTPILPKSNVLANLVTKKQTLWNDTSTFLPFGE